MSDIRVVHLVRASNGMEPFRRFWESYVRMPAGVIHDLLIIYKGFSSREDVREYEEIMAGCPHDTLYLSDAGFDIGPYFTAAMKFDNRFFLFLNSYSVVLGENWLRKFYDHISRPDVGLVGATGSWQSMYTDALAPPIGGKLPLWKYCLYRVAGRARPWFLLRFFPPFPNYHIRTNAFMISRNVMLQIRRKSFWCKFAVWEFESGWESLTRQVVSLDLKALVLGKDGHGYRAEEWDRSSTYKQKHQENLLIADNQTIRFSDSALRERRMLSGKAWGDRSVVDSDV